MKILVKKLKVSALGKGTAGIRIPREIMQQLGISFKQVVYIVIDTDTPGSFTVEVNNG